MWFFQSDFMSIMAWWGIIGYFATLIMPKPKSKQHALVMLLASGPIGWLIFIPISINVIRKNRNGKTRTHR